MSEQQRDRLRLNVPGVLALLALVLSTVALVCSLVVLL